LLYRYESGLHVGVHEARAQIAGVTRPGTRMVKLRTALKNKINNIFSVHGIHLNKESWPVKRG